MRRNLGEGLVLDVIKDSLTDIVYFKQTLYFHHKSVLLSTHVSPTHSAISMCKDQRTTFQ